MQADVSRAGSRSWPVELRFSRAARELRVQFEDGSGGAIPYELLRVESPSAETQGHGPSHGPGRPPPPSGKRGVDVTGAEMVGRYAVRIRFSDGHATGLYTWDLLRELVDRREARMADYLARLAQAGRSRD
mgnify:CR=1 FL=1